MNFLAKLKDKVLTTQGWLILLAIASLFLWLINLGKLPLRDWDEGYYGTVSQDMFNHQEWLFPTYQGQPFWLKPPLIFWLMHLSYHAFGINEWSSRLPTAIITALGVPLIYLIARQLYRNNLTAILSASVYLTLLPIVRLGRLAMLDGMINTFFLIAILSLLKGLKSSRWLIGVGIGLGLVALSKGVLAIALAAILIGFLGWDKKLKICLNPWLWLGLLLGFLPVLIWYGLQIQHYGMDFIKVHFLSQSIDRLNTVVEGNKGPITFYLMEILKYTAPWLFFFIAGLILQLQTLAPLFKGGAVGGGIKSKTSIKLNLIGSLGFLLLISLMGTKLPWYVMPFYIFFALIIGDYLSYLKSHDKKYPRLIAYLLLLCSVIVSLGFIYFTAIAFQFNLSLITGFLAISLGYTTFLFFKSQWLSIPVLIIGLYGTLVILMSSSLWNWELNEAFAVKPVGELLKNQTPPQTLIYTSFAYSRPTLDFYSDRQVLAVDDNELKKMSQKSSYLLLEDKVLETLSPKDYLTIGKSGSFTLIKTQSHN